MNYRVIDKETYYRKGVKSVITSAAVYFCMHSLKESLQELQGT